VFTGKTPVAPFANVTDAGAVSAGSPLLLSSTTTGADTGCESVTVQLLLAFAPRVVGVHCSDEITVAATRFMFTLCVDPLNAAVTVPFWFAPTAPVLIVNGAVVEPAATVTLPGTVSAGNPLLLRVTIAPLPVAACDSVTVQLLLAFAPKVVGLHCSDETTVAVDVVRLRFTLCDVPLYVAVSVPL
jgi:hypothetical protein